MPPPQGFRHAATLLVNKSARAIAVDASAAMVRAAVDRLAVDLAALAADMHTPEGAAEFLIAEFNSTVDRLPQQFDRADAKGAAAAIFARLPHTTERASRDLFLIHVPEDRLPIAAPLAIELTKRRVSVAFADYEVATASELAAAVEKGLTGHRRGVVLLTAAFRRTGWDLPVESDRLRIIRDADQSSADVLAAWIRGRASEM